MEDNMEITLPSTAKINKKVSGFSNMDFDPWSNKPTQIPTLPPTEIKAIPIIEKEPELAWESMSEAILPVTSNSDSFYASSTHFIDNTSEELDKTKAEDSKLHSDWDKNLYLGPSTDIEAEFTDSRLNNMLQAEKLFVKDRPRTKTKSHPHQSKTFNWSTYLTEETISFEEKHVPFIVETLVTNVNINPSYETLLAPANGLFLYARYAHQIQSTALFNGLLNLALHTIQNIVKTKSHDAILLCFWITNCNQLLYYLKKDNGLSVATIEQQVLIPEIIYDSYTYLVYGCQDQLNRLLEKCMLEHDIIPGLEDLEFKDRNNNRTHNRRRSKTRSLSPRQLPHSPRTITTILASINHVFETYLLHTSIAQRAIAQLYYFIASSLFNFIIKTKNYCCRAKALQLRMNLSYLEEWARNQYPDNNYQVITIQFKPLIQLLELLQCASHLKTKNSFMETVANFNMLSAIQIYFPLNNYYYEKDEQPLDKDILNLVKYRALKHPNSPIPNNADQLTKAYNNENGLNLELALKSIFHMLPFGTPNRVEMDAWWHDYAPFLPRDLIDFINNES